MLGWPLTPPQRLGLTTQLPRLVLRAGLLLHPDRRLRHDVLPTDPGRGHHRTETWVSSLPGHRHTLDLRPGLGCLLPRPGRPDPSTPDHRLRASAGHRPLQENQRDRSRAPRQGRRPRSTRQLNPDTTTRERGGRRLTTAPFGYLARICCVPEPATEGARMARGSRVREAVKELKSGNILRVEHGNGTFVNTPGAWTDLDALAQMSRAGTDGLKTSQSLIEVRRIIEVGAAELCATRRTAEDVAALKHHVQAMTEARDTSDVDAFVHHDLAFHATVLRGCANPFLAAVYDPVSYTHLRARTETSAFPPIRDNAVEHHRRILAAIADRAPGRARAAMDAHIEQTSRDLADYVGGLAEA